MLEILKEMSQLQVEAGLNKLSRPNEQKYLLFANSVILSIYP